MPSEIPIVFPCHYHRVAESIGEYVRSVGISDISSEVELILARASTFFFPLSISTNE